jgi:hypothetical protein
MAAWRQYSVEKLKGESWLKTSAIWMRNEKRKWQPAM